VRPGPVVAALRAATAADHDRVDALFAGCDLADRDSYVRLLHAHARALPAVEAVLAERQELPDWSPRTPLLREDMTDLDAGWPEPLPFDLAPDPAAGWGALYVIEGSRLGGVMLSRQVGAGLPARYLGAKHGSGQWRALLEGLDAAGGDDGWLDIAVGAARDTFRLYEQAVER